MSEYKESFDDRIFWIRGEFLNFLKKKLKKGSGDEKIDQKEIRRFVYAFILEKVLGKGVEEIKVKKESIIKFYIKVVDFCLSFGGVILDILSELNQYKDFEKLKINDSEIDADA